MTRNTRAAAETRIRAAIGQLLAAPISDGLKCHVKSLCILSGVPRATLYRSYPHLKAEFERRRGDDQAAGAPRGSAPLADPTTASPEHETARNASPTRTPNSPTCNSSNAKRSRVSPPNTTRSPRCVARPTTPRAPQAPSSHYPPATPTAGRQRRRTVAHSHRSDAGSADRVDCAGDRLSSDLRSRAQTAQEPLNHTRATLPSKPGRSTLRPRRPPNQAQMFRGRNKAANLASIRLRAASYPVRKSLVRNWSSSRKASSAGHRLMSIVGRGGGSASSLRRYV
jgi:hypothetical protein